MKLSELIQEIRDGKHNSMLNELYGEDDLAFEQER